MIDLSSTAKSVLGEARYETRLIQHKESVVVYFEDDSLLGFVAVFDSPADLLSSWRLIEMALLRQYAPHFRTAGEKAWNVYCVFLCSATADRQQVRRIRWIEEDLARTRKLASCGVVSRDNLTQVLLPVLPFQNRAEIATEDLRDRLQRRIQDIAPLASDVALKESVSPEEVVPLLGGSV